jgi:hypothetical protein
VVVVPTLAISRSGGTSTVLVESGGKQAARQVVTGPSSGGEAQIVSGLREGEQILVPVLQTGNRGTGTGRTGAGTGRNGTGTGRGGTGGGFPPGGFGGAPVVKGGAGP